MQCRDAAWSRKASDGRAAELHAWQVLLQEQRREAVEREGHLREEIETPEMELREAGHGG